jgi:hypothetical protein
MKIKNIRRVPEDCMVYNFGVSGTENYIANGVLVHNCYQGSTPAGKHAGLVNIRNVLVELAKAEVFEVALGGGEPTIHPRFAEIVRFTKDLGMVPNFTTNSLEWLKEEWAGGVLDAVGSVAFSVKYSYDVTQIRDAFISADFNGEELVRKVTIQCIDGVSSPSDMEAIFHACAFYRFPVTVLGFKTCGRGETYTPRDSKFIELLKKGKKDYHFQPRVGVDTAILAKYGDELKALGISNMLMSPQEGAFSCYIDAVEMTMAPSSYGGTPQPWNKKTWLDAYRGY